MVQYANVLFCLWLIALSFQLFCWQILTAQVTRKYKKFAWIGFVAYLINQFVTMIAISRMLIETFP